MKNNSSFKKTTILACLLLCISSVSVAHYRYYTKNFFTDSTIYGSVPADSSWFINYLLKKNSNNSKNKFLPVPGFHYTAASYDAVVINPNSDGSNNPEEGIYFKTGYLNNNNWYTDPQMVIENQKIRIRKPLEVDLIETTTRTRSLIFKLGDHNAGVLNVDRRNTALGYGALALGLDGESNSAFGAYALISHQNGKGNTALGSYALTKNIKGNNNTAAGNYANEKNLGDNNIAIGFHAGSQLVNGDSNIVIVGESAWLSTALTTTTTRSLNIGHVVFAKDMSESNNKNRGKIGIGANDPQAKLDIQGGNDADGNGGDVKAAMAFQFYDGGYRHWIRTRHTNKEDNKGNAFDIFLNTSNSKQGSTGPGTGSQLAMTINALAVIIPTRLGIATSDPKAKLDIQGGQNGDGTGGEGQSVITFQRYDKGFRHWIRTRHINQANSAGNAIDFFLNNSSHYEGSTGPHTGSKLAMTINAKAVIIPVSLGIANGTIANARQQVEIGEYENTTTKTLVQVHGGAIFNNNADLKKITQVSINTSAMPDSFALVVGGTTFIGDWATAEGSGVIIDKIYRKKASLWVQRGIVCENFVTAPVINWKDEVFKDNYQLPSIPEVELFIKKNKHLPGIPSEEEVKAHGYSLNELDLGLLEKVEHLTLYAIEQDKKATVRDKNITQLQKKLAQTNDLREELELLRNEIRQIKSQQ